MGIYQIIFLDLIRNLYQEEALKKSSAKHGLFNQTIGLMMAILKQKIS